MTEGGAPLRVVLGEWQQDEDFRRAITTPVQLVPSPTRRAEDLAPLLPGADVVLSARFSAEMGAVADRLRLILTPGAGTNLIDFAAVPDGVTVCNVYGHETGIAEYVCLAMLALTRDLLNMDARFRRGDRSDRLSGPQGQLLGKTLGIIGLGRIGWEVARLGRAFGMRVIAVTRSPDPERAAGNGLISVTAMEGLPALLAEADMVVVAVPLDPTTTGLIAGPQLVAMKSTAFLINVARGEVVDERSLYEALRERRIGGAAIDVWYDYPEAGETPPPSKLPFHELDNVILTPHVAGWTSETFRHRWAAIDENLRRLRTGEPLIGVVWPVAP